jgi:hypothetical protein
MAGRRILDRIAVAGVVAALLAGCGGGGSKTSSSPSGAASTAKVSPATYTKSVCTAFSGFISSIKARQAQLKVSAVPNTTPAQGKQLLATFVGGMTTDARKLAADVKAAGVPDVSNGQQISSALQTAFTRFEAALTTYQTQVNQLPTSSPTAFKTASSQLTTSLQQSLGGIGSGLSGLKSPQLVQAASHTPACQSLSL